MSTARTHRILTAAITAGALAAAATACGPTAAPSASTNSAAATPHAVAQPSALESATPGAHALAAYRAMWADVVAANQTSNYQAPYLSDHLSGQALLTVTDNMAVEKSRGVVTLGQPVLHPVVVSATATNVQIQDCVQETGWLEYFATTRKPVDDIPGGDRSTTATVSNESGTWKVAVINSGADGTCHITP